MKQSLSDVIIDLWKNERLPILNGLIKADNSFYSFNDNKLCKVLTCPCLDELSISDIDCLVSTIHADKYTIFAGEGSWGSDGWILVLSSTGELVWLLSGEFNPIENISIASDEILATNNNKAQIVISITKPENMRLESTVIE